MALTVTIQDQLPVGKVTHELHFVVKDERLTVHQLIQERVEQEVALHNLPLSDRFNGLVQSTDAETPLNGFKFRTPGRSTV